jgi:hypothetical protein
LVAQTVLYCRAVVDPTWELPEWERVVVVEWWGREVVLLGRVSNHGGRDNASTEDREHGGRNMCACIDPSLKLRQYAKSM